MDPESLELLEDGLRKTMLSASGAALDAGLAELGWPEMLTEMPEFAIPMVFRLLGETGSHASVLNDVVLHSAGRGLGAAPPLPYAGGGWVVWERKDESTPTLGGELPIHRIPEGETLPLAAGRAALAWWLIGSARTMIALARQHALDRVQFGKPIAAFQAVRHRLAESLVAVEGAEATLSLVDFDSLTADSGSTDTELVALLAKAAGGKAALTAAKHCQQVLGGIGFTAEHDLHRHVKRALVLDGLLGSSRELTRQAGAAVRAAGAAPRLAQL